MSLSANKSLGDLRAELRDRLGYGSMGSSSGPITSILNSVLKEAQEDLYWQFDWKLAKKIWTLTPGIDQVFIDYPDDLNPDRVISMSSDNNTGSTVTHFQPMEQGIDLCHRNSGKVSDRPRRFELREQIEIWPAPQASGYPIRLEGIKRLARFTQDGDLLSLDDDRLVFKKALAMGKRHYGHKDAESVAAEFELMIGRIKGKEAGQKRYTRQRYSARQRQDGYMIRPQVAS